MKKTIVILSSVIGVLLIAALIVPSFIDWKKYEPKARQALVDASGFDAEINGGISLSILPTPRLSVEGVKLFEPSFVQQPLVTLQRAKVILSPFSLLFGKVEVSSVVLENGSVWLYKAANGKANWQANAKSKNVNADKDDATETAVIQDGERASSRINVDNVYLDNIEIKYDDLKAKSSYVAKISSAAIDMDSLSGPYKMDATVAYGESVFDVVSKIGALSNKENLPVSTKIETGGAVFSYSGVANITKAFDAQGELNIKMDNVPKFLASLPGGVSAPDAMNSFALKGMASVSSDRVSLSDAALTLNQTPAEVAVELSGLQADIVTLSTTVAFKDVVDMGFLKGKLASVKDSSGGSSSVKSVGGVSTNAGLLPGQVTLPQNFKANINVTVPGVKYNSKTTGKVELAAIFDDKNMKGSIDAFSLPAQTDFKTDIALSFASKTPVSGSNMAVYKNPVFAANIDAGTQSLRGVLVDWLGVINSADIPQQMPDNVNIKTAVKVTSHKAKIDLNDVNVGQTAVKGFVAYQLAQQQNALPVIVADIKSGNLILPDLFAGTKGEKNAVSSPSKSVKNAEDIVPAAVKGFPYDLNVKVAMDKLVIGDKDFHDILLDIKKQGNQLRFNSVKIGNYLGTALALNGSIDNYEALSGLDMSVSAKSSKIDTFIASANVTLPSIVSSPIGAFSADVDIKGDVNNASYKGSMSVYGFSASVSGTKMNLLNPQMPDAMKLALKHPDSEKAIQFLNPDYKAQSSLMNRPFRFDAKVNHKAKITNITGLTMKLGPSTMTGMIDVTSSDVPYIKANLNVDTLPADVLAGSREKISNSASISSQSQATRREGQTPWSRDAIDTSALRAVQADMIIKAQKFSYGHTVLKNAQITANLKNGILDISRISGALDEGQLVGDITINARQAGKPINVKSSFALSDATVRAVSKLVTGKSLSKMNGGMALNVDMTASGLSSAALISDLNGEGRVQIIDPALEGVDVTALYNSVKSIDNFQGAITGLLQNTTSSGSTKFNSVDKKFQIVNGVIPIDNWDAHTDHAVMLSNGKLDFPNWKIDITNNIQIQDVDALPSFGMRIYGPLDSPQTVITRQALQDFLQSKIGNKVRDVITDKLIGEDIQNKVKDKIGVGIGDLLPFGTKKNTAEPVTDGSDSSTTTNKDDAKKQLLKGLFNELTK